jgi:hypothetical protein
MSGERPAFPTDEDIADAREERLRLDMETAFPARVQSYDPDLQVADLVPLVRRQVPQPDGSHTTEALPVLPSVPVCFPRVGVWFLSFPIAPGDTGLVVVCSGDIGPWRIGGGDVTDPGDLRRHHLSHAVFLPAGLVPRSRALTQTGAAGTSGSTTTGLVLGSDNASGPRLLLRADGAVEVETNGATALRVETNGTVHLGAATGAAFVALASSVTTQLAALKSAISGAAVVPNDGGAAFKTNLIAALSSWPGDVAATKTKAT